MAIGAGGAALIGAGASLLGAGGNMFAGGKMNWKNRMFARDMYWMQREDAMNDYHMQRQYALEDWERQNSYNEKMLGEQREYDKDIWNMQNAYNEGMLKDQRNYDSPMAQMQRFKEAGLNPNLIYGNMSAGPSFKTSGFDQGRANTSAPFDAIGMRSPSMSVPQGDPLRMDTSFIDRYFAIRERGAQVNNLEAQNELIKQNTRNARLDGAIKALKEDEGHYDFDLKKALRSYFVDAIAANTESATYKAHMANQEFHQRDKMNPLLLDKAYEELQLKRGQKVSQQLQQQLMQVELNMRKLGINPNDPVYLRVLSQILAGDFSFLDNWKK